MMDTRALKVGKVRRVWRPEPEVERAGVEVFDGVEAHERREERRALGGRVFDPEELGARVDERELAEAREDAVRGADAVPLAADEGQRLEIRREGADDAVEVGAVCLPEGMEACEVLVVCVEHLFEGERRYAVRGLACNGEEGYEEVADTWDNVWDASILRLVGSDEPLELL